MLSEGEIAGLPRVGVAMGLDLVTRSATRMLGPAAGGILLASTGLPGTYLLATALYAISFFGLLSLRYEAEVQTRPVGNIFANIVDGFRYIRGQRLDLMTNANDENPPVAPDAYSRKVGERLRSIRRQKRLSLQEVEAKSRQEFKASVLGAYERGERAISVPRLQRLARFYSVPVDQLLPMDEGPDFGVETNAALIDLTERPSRPAGIAVTIDLTRLEQLRGPEADMLSRYLTMIQVKRQDFNGRVLTIRRDDHQALAAILGTGVDGAGNRLDDLGLSYRHPVS